MPADDPSGRALPHPAVSSQSARLAEEAEEAEEAEGSWIRGTSAQTQTFRSSEFGVRSASTDLAKSCHASCGARATAVILSVWSPEPSSKPPSSTNAKVSITSAAMRFPSPDSCAKQTWTGHGGTSFLRWSKGESMHTTRGAKQRGGEPGVQTCCPSIASPPPAGQKFAICSRAHVLWVVYRHTPSSF